MCRVTRNRFTCTQKDPIHLLINHTYPTSTCDDRNSCPVNLNLFCANARFYDKVFGYTCTGCLDYKAEERRKWREEYYRTEKARLEREYER
jgi:hypothetical protein